MFPNIHSILRDVPQNSTEITLCLIVLTTFLLLTVIMYRFGLFTANMENEQNVTSYTPMTAMEKVHNPFIVSLVEASAASLEKGVKISVTSQVHCCVRFYWGMLIEDVYPMIHQTWDELQKILTDDSFASFSLQSEETIIPEPVERKVIDVKPQDDSFITQLGEPPRNRYPLVVVICDQAVLYERESGNEPPSNQVILSVTFLHVRDAVCSGPSHAISQYVRTAHGRPCNLMKVYLSTDHPGSGTSREDESASGHQSAAGDQPEPSPSSSSPASSCVVCLTAPVERVFLPCRHASVCESCSRRVTHCPMCRTVISSSFVINTANS